MKDDILQMILIIFIICLLVVFVIGVCMYSDLDMKCRLLQTDKQLLKEEIITLNRQNKQLKETLNKCGCYIDLGVGGLDIGKRDNDTERIKNN